MDRLLRDVFGGTAHRSERLADLLGNDSTPTDARSADGAPADMSPEEEAVLRELLVLAKTEPVVTKWGKFTDLKEVGKGGFGTVFSALDPVLQTRVALKLYHPTRMQRPKDELLSEARKLARVRHPNVVVVHGADEIDGQVGVWMELVEGETLWDEIRYGSPLDAEAAADVGIALCNALAAVHAAGIVHGDIKAQNVVRGTDGRIVLMDFGAARFQDPSAVDANEARAGTPAYMAPELFKLRDGQLVEPTFQSDVYAVGVLLFYLVTGKLPVQGDSAEEIHLAHDRGERMLLLSNEAPNLLDDLAGVIETGLARTPEQRWLTVAMMGDALVASRPDTPGGSTLQKVARYGGWAAGITVIVVALGWMACANFELQLGIGPDFARGWLDYFRFGVSALLPVYRTRFLGHTFRLRSLT